MDLPADILITAYHHSGAVLPEKKYVILLKGLKSKFLECLVVKRIVGGILHIEHRFHQPSLNS